VEVEGEIKLTPDTLRLVGPKSLLDTLPPLLKLPYKGRTIKENYEGKLDIILPEEKWLAKDPQEVYLEVSVKVYEEASARIPIRMVNFPRDSSAVATTRTATMHLLLPKGTDQSVLRDIVLSADFRTLQKSDSTLHIHIEKVPENGKNVQLDPQRLKIRYVKKP
jgi:hypothetical protein